jgi:hypothetical protein
MRQEKKYRSLAEKYIVPVCHNIRQSYSRKDQSKKLKLPVASCEHWMLEEVHDSLILRKYSFDVHNTTNTFLKIKFEHCQKLTKTYKRGGFVMHQVTLTTVKTDQLLTHKFK